MFLFSYKFKIKKKCEISDIYKKGQRFDCYGYKIIVSVNDCNYDRFAVIVSRKLGNAVKRNKIKRFFRELFRKNRIDSPPYYDILIQPQSGIKLNSEMVQCFKIWQEKSKKIVL